MNRDCIKNSLAIVTFLCAAAMIACAQKPAQQTNTQAQLPAIVQFDKPVVTSIAPSSLPKPFATQSADRNSRHIPQPADAKLYVPKGFKINVFAEGNFREPRWMALAPNGDVFLADSRANSVIVLRDKDKDGTAEERFVFSDALSQPFGIAFHGDWVYVANTDSIVRFKYKRPDKGRRAG